MLLSLPNRYHMLAVSLFPWLIVVGGARGSVTVGKMLRVLHSLYLNSYRCYSRQFNASSGKGNLVYLICRCNV